MEWQLYPTQILPLKSLEPNTGQIKDVPSNPRYLAEAKAAKLAKSMEQSPEMLGLREILVYPLGKKYVVIGGNMRMQLLKKAGHKDAPCKVIPAETTAEQLKRYVLIDNASFGDWEHEALANSWDDLVQDFCIDVPRFEEAGVEEEVDTSILDDIDNDIADQLQKGVLKAIQIEFKPHDYELAKMLIKDVRKKGLYLGGYLINLIQKDNENN